MAIREERHIEKRWVRDLFLDTFWRPPSWSRVKPRDLIYQRLHRIFTKSVHTPKRQKCVIIIFAKPCSLRKKKANFLVKSHLCAQGSSPYSAHYTLPFILEPCKAAHECDCVLLLSQLSHYYFMVINGNAEKKWGKNNLTKAKIAPLDSEAESVYGKHFFIVSAVE